jgi:hypothetical protein
METHGTPCSSGWIEYCVVYNLAFFKCEWTARVDKDATLKPAFPEMTVVNQNLCPLKILICYRLNI